MTKKVVHYLVALIALPFAKLGKATACNLIGHAHEDGYLFKDSPEKALFWYQKAAAKGLAEGASNVGRMHERGVGGTPYTAVEFYRDAAEAGDPWAQVTLGALLMEGKYVSENKEEAIFWYRRAEGKGFAYAYYNLASAYYYGLGVNKNPDDAFYYCLLALTGGVEESANSLLAFYEEGIGKKEDRRKAEKLLRGR